MVTSVPLEPKRTISTGSVTNFLRQLPFLFMRHAEGSAFVQFLFHRFHHGGMAMPGHQRPKTQVVIDVFVAVDIMNLAALAILYKNGIRS